MTIILGDVIVHDDGTMERRVGVQGMRDATLVEVVLALAQEVGVLREQVSRLEERRAE